jgi:hypothetical protein
MLKLKKVFKRKQAVRHIVYKGVKGEQIVQDLKKLPDCDYDGMGNFSRRGRP